MEAIRRIFLALLKETDTTFKRTMEVNWQNRMIAITGARGVGKTTFLLQHIKENHPELNQVLYLSLDSLYFYDRELIELVDEFYQYGGRYLYLDEVHKYSHWSLALKNIYDNYPKLSIVFTSSSILDIYQGDADLSRRVVKYEMTGLSFREYLLMEKIADLPILTLEQLLNNHEKIALNLPENFQPLPHFKNYLKEGYYPFFNESDYLLKLLSALNNVIGMDLAKIENLSQNKIEQIKKVLGVIAESVPFKPNITSLSQKLNINRDIILSMLYQLQKGRILNLLSAPNKGVSVLQKPEKIYLENTNLMYALKIQPEMGTIRETFFLNQLTNSGSEINYSKQTDFLVNVRYSFEIGGSKKGNRQILGLKNGFVIKDNITIGSQSTLPLWMFGLLY